MGPEMMDTAPQEYLGFRQELIAIFRARYTILGFIIAIIGVITGFTVETNNDVFISVAPVLFFSFLFTCAIINFYIDRNYRLLDAYLWARYEYNEQVSFQKAYEIVTPKGFYQLPVTITYSLLAVIGVTISVIKFNSMKVGTGKEYEYLARAIVDDTLLLVGLILLALYVFCFPYIMKRRSGRTLTRKLVVRWIQAFDILKNTPRTVFLDRDGVINVK